MCQRIHRHNNKTYWNGITKTIRKTIIQLLITIDECNDNADVASLFKTT